MSSVRIEHEVRLSAQYCRGLLDALDRFLADYVRHTPAWADTDERGEVVVHVTYEEPVARREAA